VSAALALLIAALDGGSLAPSLLSPPPLPPAVVVRNDDAEIIENLDLLENWDETKDLELMSEL
jgi:hypothetical protein